MTAILDLPLSSILPYLEHAVEKEKEKDIWQAWLTLYPLMARGKMDFVPFDQYKKDLMKPAISTTEKTHQEIEDEMLAVISAYEGR